MSDKVMPQARCPCLSLPLLGYVNVPPVKPDILCVVAPVQVLTSRRVVVSFIQVVQIRQLLCQLPETVYLQAAESVKAC